MKSLVYEHFGKVGIPTSGTFYYVPTYYAGEDSPTCFQEGECIFAHYTSDWPAGGAQECLELCRGDEDCNFFTYFVDAVPSGTPSYYLTRTCVGMSTCEGMRGCRHNDDCYSGRKNCTGEANLALLLVKCQLLIRW